MTPPLTKFLTIKQTAEALSVSVPRIYKRVHEVAFPGVKTKSACRVDPRVLEAFMEERRRRGETLG